MGRSDAFAKARAERDASLNAMVSDASAQAASRQLEIDAAQSRAATDDVAAATAAYSAETAANTGSMADSMDVSNEILEYMRDIAERETINRFTTAEISIAQTNNNNISSDMDIDGVMNKWNKDFLEILETSAEGVA